MCRYLGSFKTAEEAARAFDAKAVESGRPVETLNFPAAYGGPTVGQAYRKRKVHRLYGDPQNHINVLLQKLADVDRSNPGILRLTMSTLGVPDTRFRVRLSHAHVLLICMNVLKFVFAIRLTVMTLSVPDQCCAESLSLLHISDSLWFACCEQRFTSMKCYLKLLAGI